MRHMIARTKIAWLILAFAPTAVADWAAGQEFYQNGDYQSALLQFEAGRDSGLDGPAVHYNIAVCHFKLGKFQQARKGFQLIGERFPQMRGLAEYNLGLIARRKGDETAATGHFLRAYEESPSDKKLRILASNRLRELEPETRWWSDWSGAVGLRAGFDDNVALREETGLGAGATTESAVTDFFATFQGPWISNSGFRAEASLYIIRNFDADEFDQTEILGGAIYDWRPGDWHVQVGTHYSIGSLGGDAFDRKAGVSARAIRYLDDSNALSATYTYDDVSDADALFAGIAGSRQQLRVDYRWHSAGHRLILRVRQETNDRADPGVSPDRIGFDADYRFQPGSGLGYEGGLAFRASDYDDLVDPRSEDLLSARLALTKNLKDDWLALLEYRYSDNDSTDPTFSYDRQQISFGLIKTF